MMGLSLLELVCICFRRPFAPYYAQCSMKPACVEDIALWGSGGVGGGGLQSQ